MFNTLLIRIQYCWLQLHAMRQFNPSWTSEQDTPYKDNKLKRHILTNVWSAQYPNTGQNI